MPVTIATDHAGRFIGARDVLTGRFVPDALLRGLARALKINHLQRGRATRRPAVPNDYVSLGRAVSTVGQDLMLKAHARRLGAVTAVKPRANNGDWTGRIIRRNRMDRTVTYSKVQRAA